MCVNALSLDLRLLAIQPEMGATGIVALVLGFLILWWWWCFHRFGKGVREHDEMPSVAAGRLKRGVAISIVVGVLVGGTAWFLRELIFLDLLGGTA